MKTGLKIIISLSLILQITLVKWFGSYPHLVEKYYSNSIYPILSNFFRILFGWIPFSIGDLVYFSLALLLLIYIYKQRKYLKSHPKILLLNICTVLSIAYFTFHLVWGLNYYREPVGDKFKLNDTHTQEELIAFTKQLILKTNNTQFSITKDSTKAVVIPYSKDEILSKTISSYNQIAKKTTFLTYQNPSIKNSVFSTILTYMGYGGYLNPFTNEAQVNKLVPKFRYTVIAAHEIGHQIGYSAENETNFIGYLVTSSNGDIYFKYTAYAYALGYCLNDINKKDPALFKNLVLTINPGVRENYKELSTFWNKYQNPIEPVFKSIFSNFLKANNQTKGIQSYNAVVSLLVNYHKKHAL